MPKYNGPNDSIIGEKIYCVFERFKGPDRVSTKGRHNAQAMVIRGNPAIATIVKTMRYVE